MKNILFVCVENSCRSQMAEGFGKLYAEGKVNVYSAGSKPSGIVNPAGIEVMQEIGINTSEHTSKGFDQVSQAIDYAITLGCKDRCPFVAAENHIDWDVEDPKGHDIEFFRRTRDKIGEKVKTFIEGILE